MSIRGVSTAPFAAQGIYSPSASFNALRPYVKAEQNCGLQSCFLTVCQKIIDLVSYFFKAICCCCCGQGNNEDDTTNPAPLQPSTSNTPLMETPFIPGPTAENSDGNKPTGPTQLETPFIPGPTAEISDENKPTAPTQQPIPLTTVDLSPSSQILPFTHTVFQLVAGFFEIADMVTCEKTCKGWNGFSKMESLSSFWASMSKKAGVPLIHGQERNRRADLRALYSITLSGKLISCLGEMVEETPCIKATILSLLDKPDPFEMTKTMRDNYLLVVVLSKVQRTAGKEFRFFLDEGNLKEQPYSYTEEWRLLKEKNIRCEYVNGEELLIPLSLNNLKKLCPLTLRQSDRMPVIEDDEFVQQYDACSEKVRVWFMRKCRVKHDGNTSFDEQNKDLNRKGFQSMSLLDRIYANCVFKIKSGTYLDSEKSWEPVTPLRFPDIIHFNNKKYHAMIYASKRGINDSIHFFRSFLFDEEEAYAVVPCISVEL